MKSTAERAAEAVNDYFSLAMKQLKREERETLARGTVRAIMRGSIRLEYIGHKRTTSQNNFIHLLFKWLAQEMGGIDWTVVKDGIKEKYGVRSDNPFGGLLPKPTHLYTWEEITPLVEGCFTEAAERGIDVEAFIAEWERMRHERAA